MKTLLIFPPQWHPATPYLSVPLLVSQMQNAGFEAEGWDLNVEFYNDILTIDNIKSVVDLLMKEYRNCVLPNDRYDKISTLLCSQKYKIDFALKYVEEAKSILKSNDFYNPVLFLKAKKVINYALEIISLKYYPVKISLSDFSYPSKDMTYENIKEICDNPSKNIFFDYIKKRLAKKNIDDYDLVGVSIAHSNQLIAIFTLGKLLKEYNKAHITFGGNLVTRIKDIVFKYNEIFDKYTDSLLVGNGEYSIIKLASAIENKKSFDDVDGLFYKNKYNKIICNEMKPFNMMSSISELSFDGYNLKNYFIPEIIIPMQLTKGCYWGKCTFCDFFYGKTDYIQDSVENIVKKIEKLKKRYNISNFEFVDNAVSPLLYDKLSDELIKRNLNISFYSMVRCEKTFSLSLFKKLKKAGLKMLLWGIESASPKVLELMNKGINIENVRTLLSSSASENIWNHAYFIFGFPGETQIDSNITLDFILKNINTIDSYSAQPFTLNKHSYLSKNPDELYIYDIEDKEELMPNLEYKSNITSKQKTEEALMALHKTYLQQNKLTLWKILTPDEYLFLYVIKYGRNYIKNYKFDPVKANIPEIL